MSFDLNRLSGIRAIYCLGITLACFPAMFVFSMTTGGLAAIIFGSIGTAIFSVGTVLLFYNRKGSEKPYGALDNAVALFYFFTVVTVISQTVLAFTLGDFTIDNCVIICS